MVVAAANSVVLGCIARAPDRIAQLLTPESPCYGLVESPCMGSNLEKIIER